MTNLHSVARRILIVAALIVGTVLVADRFLPGHWTLNHETTIRASRDAVYAQLESPRHWQDWNQAHWSASSPSVEYSGPSKGAGATIRGQYGQHRVVIKISETRPNRGIDYELLLDGARSAMHGSIRLAPVSGDTHVRWTVQYQGGEAPLERYAGLLLKWQLGDDMETSLGRLKELVERKK